MSFRLKIVLSIVTLSFLVMIGVLWQSLGFLQNRLQQQMMESNEVIIRQLRQHSAIEALLTENFGQIQLELQQLVVDSSFSVVLVVDYEEKVMASSDRMLLGTDLMDMVMGPEWYIDEMEAGGSVVGKIAYRYNNAAAEAITNSALRFGLILAVTGFIFVACLGYLVGTLFSRRIERIANSLNVISSGNLEQFLVDEKNDEIGRLSRFVLAMGKKVSAQMSELMSVEERMRIALQAAGAGAWKWDSASDTLQWSAKNFQILGYMPAEHKPSYELWLSSVHSEDLDRVKEAVRQMWRKKSEIDVEYRILRRHGEVRWMRSVGRMFLDHAGKPTEIYGLQIDISDYKKITHDVENEKLLFDAMLNQAEDAVVAVDVNQTIITANASAFGLLGHSGETMLGKHISTILSGPDAAMVNEFIDRDISQSGSAIRSLLRECKLVRRNGEIISVRMSLEKHQDGDFYNFYLFSFRVV